jgi:hypothetical protein
LRGEIPPALAEYREGKEARRPSSLELQEAWNEDTAQDYSVMFGRESRIVVGSLVQQMSPVGPSPLYNCQ